MRWTFFPASRHFHNSSTIRLLLLDWPTLPTILLILPSLLSVVFIKQRLEGRQQNIFGSLIVAQSSSQNKFQKVLKGTKVSPNHSVNRKLKKPKSRSPIASSVVSVRTSRDHRHFGPRHRT